MAATGSHRSTKSVHPADWLRLPAAARTAGLSAATLRRLADSGRIPCYRRPGGPRLFRRRDLDGRCVAPVDEADRETLRASLDRLAVSLAAATNLADTLRTLADGLFELGGVADCAAAPPTSQHAAGELGERIVAAVAAAEGVVADRRLVIRLDREKLLARLRRTTRGDVEDDILAALTAILSPSASGIAPR